MAKCIVVQGTMPVAGMRLPSTAFFRISHPNGWRVAPFMNRNMALKSAISRGRRAAVQNDAFLRAIKEVL